MDLKRIFERLGGEGKVRVLAALRTSKPDPACLDRLRLLGLVVDRVVGNKVIGRIEESQVAQLEASDDVLEVERSVRLRPRSEVG